MAQPVLPRERPTAAARAMHADGFNPSGTRASGFNSGGFNGSQFDPGPHPGLHPGPWAQGCGRMLVPAGSLALLSRGFAPHHAGIDIAAPHGDPVRAAAAGHLSFLGTDPAYGLFIDILHPGGLITRYGHLSAFAPGLTPGGAIRAGAQIGRIGATGNAQGAHLHFEVRAGGRALDPMPFLHGTNCPSRGEPVQEARAPRR